MRVACMLLFRTLTLPVIPMSASVSAVLDRAGQSASQEVRMSGWIGSLWFKFLGLDQFIFQCRLHWCEPTAVIGGVGGTSRVLYQHPESNACTIFCPPAGAWTYMEAVIVFLTSSSVITSAMQAFALQQDTHKDKSCRLHS